MEPEKIKKIIRYFEPTAELLSASVYGRGHINRTFLITLKTEDKTERKLILQKINRHVFSDPAKLMENIMGVTVCLQKKIAERGGDPGRETLRFVRTTEGIPYYLDPDGEYWRASLFIENAVCREKTDDPKIFKGCGNVFGGFLSMLSDYPADTLHETIHGFHDTRRYFEKFREAVAKDPLRRASFMKKEVDLILAHEDLVDQAAEIKTSGKLPLRVTHNDTKLSNVLTDRATGKAICVVDLDTVMPGFAMYDFGDSIRSGANTAARDERDLNRVSCDMELFAAYADGFLEECGKILTAEEISLLPFGAKMMAFECGMRYLMDYLEGDVFFQTAREAQNADCARVQLRLFEDIEKKQEKMRSLLEKYMP